MNLLTADEQEDLGHRGIALASTTLNGKVLKRGVAGRFLKDQSEAVNPEKSIGLSRNSAFWK